ncbi:glycosyltransferase family 39 protein [Candidatus Poribacteria bacterium]|nr:glycosyltransferase family 39 protein [Candidatus Poribacteria bacterium]
MNWKKAISHNIILPIVGLTVFFWLYHKFAVYVMTTLNISLGAIGPKAAPLYAKLQTDFSLWVIPAIITLSAYIIVFRTFFEKRKIPTYILLPAFILLLVLIDTTVAMIDGGLKAVEEPYTRSGLEYYADVPKVEGIREFLRDYTKLLGTLSGHAQTHPPGGVLFLWLVSQLFGRGLLQAAFSTIVFTSFTVIPVYLLAKEIYGENTAKYALGLFLITPNMVMFTATAMDGPFSFFPIWSVYLFYKALSSRTVLYSILTGIALGFGMLMNYTTVVIGVFFIIAAIITFFAKREKFKTTLAALSIAGGTFIFFYLFLYLWAKYNFISALWTSYKKDEGGMGTGYENPGRYFNVSIANLFAFLIGVGIPLTTIWLHEIIAEYRRLIHSRQVDIYILAYVLTLLGISFSTLFTLEVERIWMFIVPFIVMPAAKHLYEKHRSWEFYAVASLLCLQILLSEIFWYTYW